MSSTRLLKYIWEMLIYDAFMLLSHLLEGEKKKTEGRQLHKAVTSMAQGKSIYAAGWAENKFTLMMMVPYPRKSPNTRSSLTEINLFPIFKTKKCFGCLGGSVVRICLPVQETWVGSLIQENPMCHGAAKPMHHDYWACALEPMSRNYWSLLTLEAMLHNRRSYQNEKPMHCNEEQASLATTREKIVQQRRPSTTKNK